MLNRTKKQRMTITIITLALFQVMGLVSSVHAILGARTAQGAIAWVVSLNTVSIVAVPAYWIFGRSKFKGYIDARRDTSLGIDSHRSEALERLRAFAVDVPPQFPEYQAIKSLAQIPFLRGNSVRLLVDGEATYDDIYAGIEEAKDYVLFQFYIVRADASGNRF